MVISVQTIYNTRPSKLNIKTFTTDYRANWVSMNHTLLTPTNNFSASNIQYKTLKLNIKTINDGSHNMWVCTICNKTPNSDFSARNIHYKPIKTDISNILHYLSHQLGETNSLFMHDYTPYCCVSKKNDKINNEILTRTFILIKNNII